MLRLGSPPLPRPCWGLTQKWEGLGGDFEEPDALGEPGHDPVEAEAEENGQHRQDGPVLGDEDDLNREGALRQGGQEPRGGSPRGGWRPGPWGP